jgi:hypothetical protein
MMSDDEDLDEVDTVLKYYSALRNYSHVRRRMLLFNVQVLTKLILVLQDGACCIKCGNYHSRQEDQLLLCDGAQYCTPHGVHMMCCEPVIDTVPNGAWYCPLHPSGSKLRPKVLSTRYKQLIVIIYQA